MNSQLVKPAYLHFFFLGAIRSKKCILCHDPVMGHRLYFEKLCPKNKDYIKLFKLGFLSSLHYNAHHFNCVNKVMFSLKLINKIISRVLNSIIKFIEAPDNVISFYL